MSKQSSELTRRDFVGRICQSVAAGAFVPGLMPFYRDDAVDAAARDTVLVVCELNGGNDGLNTLVPYGDDNYYKLRRRIGIKEKDLWKLDEHFGLHPSLKPLRPLWDQGAFALIQCVGYPKPNRSHFHSMDIWQAADPELSTARSGWLGRAADALPTAGGIAPALSVTSALPLAMRSGKRPIPALASLRELQIVTDTRSSYDARMERRLLRENLSLSAKAKPSIAAASRAFAAAMEDSRRIQKVTKAYRPAARYPRGLGDRLRLIAQLLDAGHPGRIFYCGMGGFDTHGNQAGSHRRLLSQFADSMAAFFQDLEAHGQVMRVVVLAYSEFGRRVQENGSLGTDHGAGGLALLLGPSAVGGIHGTKPSLSDLGRGDLKFTTDFRRVYDELLGRWLRVPPKPVLGARFEAVGALRGREV
ncbi:MAG: hypothetical protein CSA62_08515 [Planctomycetota bacterium]|nr:MAG: hypothetical protein CSA62_08515 [Planctomycetota bacterium]